MNEHSDKATAGERRAFLSASARLLLLYSSPAMLQAATANDHHIFIAQKAKKLSNEQATSLRILVPTGSTANIRPIVKQFRELAGINIEVDEAPVDEINTQLILNIMGGHSGYDLALPATFGVPDLVAANVIIPLSEYASIHEPQGFEDGILYTTGNTFDEHLYGYQADGDAYVMFYQRELLESKEEQARYSERYGEPLTIPDTWEQLDRQMAYFHRKESGLIGGLLYRTPSYLAWEWWIRFHAKGIWPLSKTLVPQINSEPGILALEEMIRATEYLAPEVRTLGLFDNWERYSKGDIFCNIGWGGTQKYLNREGSPMCGNMLYGMTPGGIVNNQLIKTPYFNWGWNYVVTTECRTPELAYLFTLFASTPHMSALAVKQKDGFFDPIRQEHYKDSEIAKIYSPEFLQTHKKSLALAIPDLYLANQGEYFKTLSVGLDKAVFGTWSPEDALNRVSQEWELISKRTDKEKQTGRWLNLRNKYPVDVQIHFSDI